MKFTLLEESPHIEFIYGFWTKKGIEWIDDKEKFYPQRAAIQNQGGMAFLIYRSYSCKKVSGKFTYPFFALLPKIPFKVSDKFVMANRNNPNPPKTDNIISIIKSKTHSFKVNVIKILPDYIQKLLEHIFVI